MFSYVCPYVTARYRRGCMITVPHLHYRHWDQRMRWAGDQYATLLVGLWWPQSRERRAA